MDGLLIDSEPLWREVEVEIYRKIGVPVTAAMLQKTMGVRIDEGIRYWCEQYGVAENTKAVAARMTDGVIKAIRERGNTRAGVQHILNFFKAKSLPLALASSSNERIIDAILNKLGITSAFQVVYSAENEKYGKPHPGVNISAAAQLGIEPRACLVLEDSWNGVLAAKAGSMKCVCVPDEGLRGDPRLVIADAVINSLAEIDETLWENLNM